jgi:hypothetical protein
VSDERPLSEVIDALEAMGRGEIIKSAIIPKPGLSAS